MRLFFGHESNSLEQVEETLEKAIRDEKQLRTLISTLPLISWARGSSSPFLVLSLFSPSASWLFILQHFYLLMIPFILHHLYLLVKNRWGCGNIPRGNILKSIYSKKIPQLDHNDFLSLSRDHWPNMCSRSSKLVIFSFLSNKHKQAYYYVVLNYARYLSALVFSSISFFTGQTSTMQVYITVSLWSMQDIDSISTVLMVQNSRLFMKSGNRQLFVKHKQEYIVKTWL